MMAAVFKFRPIAQLLIFELHTGESAFSTFPICDASLERIVLPRGFAAFALFSGLDAYPCLFVAMTEPIGLIASFDDMAVMRQTIQKRCCHLCIAKDMAHSPKVRFVVMITLVCS